MYTYDNKKHMLSHWISFYIINCLIVYVMSINEHAPPLHLYCYAIESSLHQEESSFIKMGF
jgi:hypothetical protein